MLSLEKYEPAINAEVNRETFTLTANSGPFLLVKPVSTSRMPWTPELPTTGINMEPGTTHTWNLEPIRICLLVGILLTAVVTYPDVKYG